MDDKLSVVAFGDPQIYEDMLKSINRLAYSKNVDQRSPFQEFEVTKHTYCDVASYLISSLRSVARKQSDNVQSQVGFYLSLAQSPEKVLSIHLKYDDVKVEVIEVSGLRSDHPQIFDRQTDNLEQLTQSFY